jgi:hypothetical protein
MEQKPSIGRIITYNNPGQGPQLFSSSSPWRLRPVLTVPEKGIKRVTTFDEGGYIFPSDDQHTGLPE